MKINTKTAICILLSLLFFSASEVRAVEEIRYAAYESSSSGTIIRHYTNNVDVVCYHNMYNPYFMIYKTGVSSTNVLYLPPMDTIYDFEIYNDTVYFCGEGQFPRAGAAVVGYFAIADMSGTSYANVSYVTLPAMKMVRAIEVGWFASRKHVVGVGEAINSEGMMVDMIDESTYWKVNFGDVGGDTVALSDLTITANYVVVTSTMPATGFATKGRVWFFAKPSTPGQSLFPYYNVYFQDFVNSSGLTRKFLVRSRGDYIATAYRVDMSLMGYNPFIISYYNGPAYVRSVMIDEASESMIQLGDMQLTEGSKSLALLLNGQYKTGAGSTPRSVVYEIPNYYPVPAMVDAHVYDGVFFESIDHMWLTNLDNQHFVLSGYQPYGYGTPYYMKFHYGYFGDNTCLDAKSTLARNIEIEHKEKYDYIKNTVTLQIPQVMSQQIKPMEIVTPCHKYTPVQSNENKNKQ